MRNLSWYRFPLAFLLAASASAVAAESFCADLEGFTPSQVGELSVSGTSSPAPEAICGTSRAQSGVMSRHCYWSFPYRSDASKQRFETIVQRVAACTNDDHALPSNDAVNHPDSYDLRRFEIGNTTISVSLKDKAGLQQTMVFVRVSATP